MQWFKVFPSLKRDPRVRVLAKALGVNVYEALGRIVALYCEVAERAETGSLRGWSDDEIAAAAGYIDDRQGNTSGGVEATSGSDKTVSGALRTAHIIQRAKGRYYIVPTWLDTHSRMFNERERIQKHRSKVRVTVRVPNANGNASERERGEKRTDLDRQREEAQTDGTRTADGGGVARAAQGDTVPPPSGLRQESNQANREDPVEALYEVHDAVHRMGETFDHRGQLQRVVIGQDGKPTLQAMQPGQGWYNIRTVRRMTAGEMRAWTDARIKVLAGRGVPAERTRRPVAAS